MTTSIILQTNNENDNTFGDSHFSIILPYTKDHLWAMQLNSFNFRPMFNIFEKDTQYLKVKLYLRYFEPHQSPPDDKWEKKDWVNILSKHEYTFHYDALPFLTSSDFASVGTKIMDENKWSIKWEKENNIPEGTFTDDLTCYCYDEDKKHLFMREISTWTEILHNQTIVLKNGTKISDGNFKFINDVEKFVFYQSYHSAKDDHYRDIIDKKMFWYVPDQKYYATITDTDTLRDYIIVTEGEKINRCYIDDLLKRNLNYNIYPGKIDDDNDDDNNENILNDPDIDYTHDWGEDVGGDYSYYSKDFKKFHYYNPTGHSGGVYDVNNNGHDYIIIISPAALDPVHESTNDIMELEHEYNPHMQWSHWAHDGYFYWRNTNRHYEVSGDKTYFVIDDTKYHINEILVEEEQERNHPEEEEDDGDEDLDKLTKVVSVGEFLINPLSQYNSTKNRLEIAFEVSMDVLETDNDNNIIKKYYSRGYVYKIKIIDITDKLSEITGFVKGQVKQETLAEAKHETDKNEQKANYLIIRADNMFKPYDFDYLTISCDKVYNTGYIVNQNKYISDPCESTVFYQNQIIGYLMNTVCSNQYMTTGYGFPNKYYIKTSDFLNIRFTLRYDNGEKVDLQSPLTLVLTLSPE